MINSLKEKSFFHFSKIRFESDIAETPNKNEIIGIGKSKNIPNNDNAGARQITHKFIIERIVALAVEDIIADSSLNFSLNIEKIIEMIIKVAVRKAGIIKSHLGWNSCVIFNLLNFQNSFLHIFFCQIRDIFFKFFHLLFA